MTLLLPSPVLAVDISWVIFAVFIVIGILNAIFKAVGGKQQRPAAGGPGRQPPRPRNVRLQKEIDAFLQQVRGKVDADDVPIEIVPQQERRAQQAARRPQSKKPPRRPARPKPKSVERHAAPGAGAATREPPGSKRLGEQVRTHHLDRDVEEHVEEYLDHRVEESVKGHLGTSDEGRRAAAVQLPRAAPGRTHRLVSLLRDPAGVRQAIVLNEILSPPLARRKE